MKLRIRQLMSILALVGIAISFNNCGELKVSKLETSSTERDQPDETESPGPTLPPALACATTPPSTSGRVLYVDGTSGDDSVIYSNNGVDRPWRTLGRAAWGSTNRAAPNAGEAAQAGDVVRVQAGTYDFAGSIGSRWSAVYNPVNQGTADNPIVFEALGAVSLTAPNAASPLIGCAGRNYVHWQGSWNLDEATALATADTGLVVLNGATGCGVDGITVDGNGQSSWVDNHTGVRVESCNSCFVRNSTLHSILHPNMNHNGAGIMLYNSDDTMIENNRIYNVGAGVFVKGVFGVSDPQSRTIIRNNLIYDCGECILVSDSRDTKMYQNILRDGRFGFIALARELGEFYHPVNDVFANNTIHNMSVACYFIKGDSHENVRIWNNICSTAQRAFYVEGVPMPTEETIDVEHNLYWNVDRYVADSTGNYTFDAAKSAYGHDAAAPFSIVASPLFVGEAEDDFRLCAGIQSPVGCTAASPAGELAVDLLDLNRNGNFADLIPGGAYLSGNEIIGRCTAEQ